MTVDEAISQLYLLLSNTEDQTLFALRACAVLRPIARPDLSAKRAAAGLAGAVAKHKNITPKSEVALGAKDMDVAIATNQLAKPMALATNQLASVEAIATNQLAIATSEQAKTGTSELSEVWQMPETAQYIYSSKSLMSSRRTKRLERGEVVGLTKSDVLEAVHAVEAAYRSYGHCLRPSERSPHRRHIPARLAEGWDRDELVLAVHGNHLDPWHQKVGKHDLDYVLRNSEQVARFVDVARRGQGAPDMATEVQDAAVVARYAVGDE
jgi:hypothetical protein